MLDDVQVHGWALWSGAKRPAKTPCFAGVIGGSLAALLILPPRPPPMRDPDFQEALRRYARLRRSAYDLAAGLVDPSGIQGIRLTEIDGHALDVWQRTWIRGHPLGYGGWDWNGLVERVCRRPSAFQVAIWSWEELCGMAVGRMSKRRPSGTRHTISVHYLEGSPQPMHPLRGKVTALALTIAESYGRQLGAERIRLVDPLPGVYRLDEQLGFSIARQSAASLWFVKRISTHGSFRL